MASRWPPSKNISLLLALFVAASAMLGMAETAASADPGSRGAPLAPGYQWKLSFTPYGWLPWLRGEQTVKGRTPRRRPRRPFGVTSGCADDFRASGMCLAADIGE